TAMVVSDNLRSGITKACFYEPQVNRTYAEMAAHYGTAISPARPYRARDKAKVEVAVQIATRFIIAKLRKPPVLLALGIERGHRRTGGADQQSRVAPSRRQPSCAVRGDRTFDPQVFAG